MLHIPPGPGANKKPRYNTGALDMIMHQWHDITSPVRSMRATTNGLMRSVVSLCCEFDTEKLFEQIFLYSMQQLTLIYGKSLTNYGFRQ